MFVYKTGGREAPTPSLLDPWLCTFSQERLFLNYVDFVEFVLSPEPQKGGDRVLIRDNKMSHRKQLVLHSHIGKECHLLLLKSWIKKNGTGA